jgi:xanthine dehydrogenase large subunit
MPSVGRNLPHDSAIGHVTGESKYVDDLPFAKNELIVDIFWSRIAHGRIRSVDTSAAAAIPGIVALFTYNDLPGHNLFGPIIQDEVLLAEHEVMFIGHPIVVIAAESREAAGAARKAIAVDIEELEPIFTIDAAKKALWQIGERRTIRRGDVAAAFCDAEEILEGQWRCGGQDHFYLESQAALAWPGEHDSLVVHSSTQNPSEVQEVIAHVLGLPINKVTVVTRRMGGAFGGKE